MLALITFAAGTTASASPKAKDYLVIESIQVSAESSDTVDVTLRNVSDRTITAWCLDITGGSSDGSSPFHETRYEDLYRFEPEETRGQIAPGKTLVERLSYPGLNFSEDRFENGDYSVLSIQASCVFLEDGKSAGSNSSAIEDILSRRLAESKAALLLREHFEARMDDSFRTLAWLAELRDARRDEDTRPVVMRRPSKNKVLEIREQRAYKSLSYYTAAEALHLYEQRAWTPSEVLEWVASDLAKITSNSLKNLPPSLREEAAR